MLWSSDFDDGNTSCNGFVIYSVSTCIRDSSNIQFLIYSISVNFSDSFGKKCFDYRNANTFEQNYALFINNIGENPLVCLW